MLSGIGFLGGMGHLNAQAVHALHEGGRLFHALAQALAANQLHGFHQGAGRIAQEHPIDRIMDVNLEAGRIQKGGF